MVERPMPRWARPAAGWLLAAAGCVLLLRADLDRRRAAFDTDARIVHRLLSQQAAQHDAVLATLALLQPGAAAGGEAAPEQRLPALVPQVLQVLRRDPDERWPPVLAQAEAASAQLRRPVLAEADLAAGRYTLVQAGHPASYALRIDAAAAVPWADWPLARDGLVRVTLEYAGARWVLQPGAGDGGRWPLTATKALASASQPFELTAVRPQQWRELPWGPMLAWCAAVALAGVGLAAWQRQREAARRAQALLRIGQAGRLNALGELAAGMAHELNQPLTALLASTQAAQRLLDDGDGPDLATARQALQHSAQQARRAADVVARLRRLVQPAGDTPAPVPLRLAEVVGGVLDLLSPQLREQGVATELQGLADAPPVAADAVALEQIVHNLVHNALQAMAAVPATQRRLRVAAAAGAGDTVALSVRDSGPGFAAGALERAFEPFFTTRAGGLGLGLSLCESLAAGMGGRLQARNAAGGGAELTLVLPRAAAEAPRR